MGKGRLRTSLISFGLSTHARGLGIKAVKHTREKTTFMLLREKMPLQWRDEMRKVVDIRGLNIYRHIGMSISLH